VNARNLRGILRAAKGCQLIVNASASVFNEIVLRAALRLRAHYLDLSSHLTRQPFHAEQFKYAKKFVQKNRAAVINAGAAPGLTNLLVTRAADQATKLSRRRPLYESSESMTHLAMVAGSFSMKQYPIRAFIAMGNSNSRRFELENSAHGASEMLWWCLPRRTSATAALTPCAV
jgi:hypothetical protein